MGDGDTDVQMVSRDSSYEMLQQSAGDENDIILIGGRPR